jgi:putative endonuclease
MSSETDNKPWFVYILRCADDTLYTGITTDVDKRMNQHNGLLSKGAKYTRARQPVKLVYQESSISRAEASKREYTIKCLSRTQKENIIELHQLKDY